eukprot:12907638-Heterocapsa_arctica.AAC.1
MYAQAVGLGSVWYLGNVQMYSWSVPPAGDLKVLVVLTGCPPVMIKPSAQCTMSTKVFLVSVPTTHITVATSPSSPWIRSPL